MFTEDSIKELVEKAMAIASQKFNEKAFDEAEVVINQVIKVDPNNVAGWQLLGMVKHMTGNFQESIAFFSKALEIDPNNPENHNNIAMSKSHLGQYQEAIESLLKAIELNPECSYLHSNIGLQYRNNMSVDKAIESFQKSLMLVEEPKTLGMLGGCYGEKKNLEEAEKCFKRAIEIEPNFAAAHVDLAHVYHLRGEWEKAWQEYEWRFSVYEQLQCWNRIFGNEKRWRKENPEGKTIIVYGEQGSGDSINFFRYVKILKSLGARVILHCQESLRSLFEDQVDETWTENPAAITSVPNYDYHCSMMSLPYILGCEIPSEPYLKAKENINIDNYSFNIGVAWAGSPQHPNDYQRSCNLSYFRPIHDLPGVRLFNLVKDKRPRAYRFKPQPIDLTDGTSDMQIVDLTSRMTDFGETAKIIGSMDLIISVDTAVLHLAGAMGKKAWGLLPWNPDWRWGIEGEKTIWYPSVRLFRQEKLGDWEGVFSQITKEVQSEQRAYR